MITYDYVKTRREDVRPITPKAAAVTRKVMRAFTRLNVWVFKKSQGRLMKNFPGGYPICVVSMTGRKSGQKREIALIHLPHGDNKIIVASQGGMDTHPVWHYNLQANPNIDIMVGGDTHAYTARQVSDNEKSDLWPHLLSLYPDFDEYQARTDRNIPVYLCEPT
ncbi:MAG: nitroreductase family deazaflavin-dependent oxidoreductase [Pseudomonadales bacterium]